MSVAEERWLEVDRFLTGTLVGEDGVLAQAREASAAGGLPHIEVSAPQGKLLMLLAQLTGARKVLEIGTLGGYSTIWLARGLPEDGEIITCEYEPKHAEVAQQNLERAGLAGKVSIRVGAALDTLPRLEAEEAGPFDLVFIDADKVNNANYVQWALKLTRPGSLIVLDNVVRGGSVLDSGEGNDDEAAAIRGTRGALELLGSDERLEATAVQTLGAKGWDGFALARVK
ncbi:O-methyltransferase [Arthrobacter crystallopoietes BAB-32]|uniref:O-methyltransferase n=1 Tax=Arthrobacter crystallopoietes BAB-32 TaxID=1246476 RepID=N1URC2_9MICC|nr:O-methyltransferase [Arthrobacter crystallopoietes]EMY32976.1 O-methyltransferase [Arthrobacter crystallopoietes BAB-32]